ncbi:hypothetical protein [Azoarcus sp. CIB]|uniref:hypothetical protein n=1 Tax=Aromatoleum sp. (strain CIB) TaxID=198107 RepID=UPI00067D627B|nr:hypothetical protein [Azoarcus sp. CIB]
MKASELRATALELIEQQIAECQTMRQEYQQGSKDIDDVIRVSNWLHGSLRLAARLGAITSHEWEELQARGDK